MSRFPWLWALALVASATHADQDVAKSSADPKDIKLPPMPSPRNSWNQQKCYDCRDCEHFNSNLEIRLCPVDENSEKMHKCVTYSEKFNHIDKPWFVRGCASEIGLCRDIIESHNHGNSQGKIISCNECEGDLCNGVSRSLPLSILTFIVGPILMKLALA